MQLLTSFILFFIAFIGWSLALGLIYFIIYLKRDNTSLKRALLDKYATKQSTDLKDRLVEQMKIAHNRMQEVTDEVNDEIEEVRNEILQAQTLINQTINAQNNPHNQEEQESQEQATPYVDEKTFEQTLETYNFNETQAFKVKH